VCGESLVDIHVPTSLSMYYEALHINLWLSGLGYTRGMEGILSIVNTCSTLNKGLDPGINWG
jgi:hypothetical protein